MPPPHATRLNWPSSAPSSSKSTRHAAGAISSKTPAPSPRAIWDAAQRLINECRKTGLLPLDICAIDDKRAADGLENLDDQDVEAEAERIVNYTERAPLTFTPVSFWDGLPVYVEMLVEKIDLKNLFAPVCAKYHVAFANGGGWNDINGRAAMMLRFAEHEASGRQCVLLYCGDHDPGGLNISDFLRSNFADLKRAVGWSPDRLIIDRYEALGAWLADGSKGDRPQPLSETEALAARGGFWPLDPSLGLAG